MSREILTGIDKPDQLLTAEDLDYLENFLWYDIETNADLGRMDNEMGRHCREIAAKLRLQHPIMCRRIENTKKFLAEHGGQ